MSGNQNLGSAFALMDSYLKQVRGESKQAGLGKAATDPSEPTSHPVMKADDGTQPAREGERSKENDADIKKNLGEAGNAGQRDAGAGTSTKPTDTIGTQKMDAAETKGNVPNPKSER